MLGTQTFALGITSFPRSYGLLEIPSGYITHQKMKKVDILPQFLLIENTG
jgi:hypothetical protein